MTGYPCVCECHVELENHPTDKCKCGQSVQSPGRWSRRDTLKAASMLGAHAVIASPQRSEKDCVPPGDHGSACPKPPIPAQPWVANVDQGQTIPPPPPRTAPQPVWQDPNRPAPGDPSEVSWFQEQIKKSRTVGPTFGPRKYEYLPYLVVRAKSADRGGRPFSDVFWESPDIFVAPNLDVSDAPLTPPSTAGLAVAQVPNTLYAHVWNLGNSPAYDVRVEFYVCDPSLGISRASGRLIGAAYINLGNRFSHFPEWRRVDGPSGAYMSLGAHAIVRCPATWVPTYENGGHECLVVRAFEPLKDPLSPDQFSAAADRHVAQRNIAVALTHSPATFDVAFDLGFPETSASARVDIEIAPPSSMEFLKLYVGRGGTPIAPATEPLAVGFHAHTHSGREREFERMPFLYRQCRLRRSEVVDRGCARADIGFHASVQSLTRGEGYVIRVRQHVEGRIVGGYSLAMLGG